MEDKLFLLLRIGLGTEQISEKVLCQIAEMTETEWMHVREFSLKQGVAAIALDGVNRLYVQYNQQLISPNISQDKWKTFLLEWTGIMLMEEQANQHQQEVMEELSKKWCAHGCKVMVMKGQAHGTFYPHPFHRSVGDIDIYLFGDYVKGNDIARKEGANVDESWYKHSVISYKGETFENHQFFVTTRTDREGKLLEKELEEELFRHSNNPNNTEFKTLTESTIMAPIQWVAMFLTYHSCSHFMSEGIRLKQLLDWAMFLNEHQHDVDWLQFYGFCERFHLSRFVDAATAIAVNYIGIKLKNNNIRVDSPYTNRVILSALYDDDYVFGSGKGNWYNRFHLIRNLWKYRWKYMDIYQMSPLRKLWYYATGYIFKTE